LNALNTNNIQAIAYAQAAITSGNRASGAANAGNAYWESAQFQAEQNYSNMVVALGQAELGLLTSLQNAWSAGGYGTVTVTTTEVLENEIAILQNGLPASVVQMLTQAGLDSATIALMQNFVDAMDVNTVVGTFPAQLTNPSLVSAVQNFDSAFAPPSVMAYLTQEFGPLRARLLRVTFMNLGPGTADQLEATSFTLTQTRGPACKPVVETAFPQALGNLAPFIISNLYVTVDFAGCSSKALFEAVVPFTANSGGVQQTITLGPVTP